VRQPIVVLWILRKPLTRYLETNYGTMEELGIPNGYRVAVHKLYEKVRAKIRTSEGMSECFGSDIGVKQGCHLSPTLFGIYIDKLEA
jgi:anaerobic selenocysteine-containing dehydrogenase